MRVPMSRLIVAQWAGSVKLTERAALIMLSLHWSNFSMVAAERGPYCKNSLVFFISSACIFLVQNAWSYCPAGSLLAMATPPATLAGPGPADGFAPTGTVVPWWDYRGQLSSSEVYPSFLYSVAWRAPPSAVTAPPVKPLSGLHRFESECTGLSFAILQSLLSPGSTREIRGSCT